MIDTSQLNAVPIGNKRSPKEPLAIGFKIDFASQTLQDVDFVSLQQRNVIDHVQCLYLDGSGLTAAATITVQGTGQIINAEPNVQGFYPVLTMGANRLRFAAAAGSGILNVQALNVDRGAARWSTIAASTGAQSVTVTNSPLPVADASISAIISGGKLAVADSVLDGTITSNRVYVREDFIDGCIGGGKLYTMGGMQYGASTNIQTAVRSNKAVQTNIAAGGLSSGVLVTGAPGYCIEGFSVLLDPRAYVTGANTSTIALSDSAFGLIYQAQYYLPAALSSPANGLGPIVLLQSPPGFFWNNKTANSTLSVNLTIGTTAGVIQVNVNYGQLAWVG